MRILLMTVHAMVVGAKWAGLCISERADLQELALTVTGSRIHSLHRMMKNQKIKHFCTNRKATVTQRNILYNRCEQKSTEQLKTGKNKSEQFTNII